MISQVVMIPKNGSVLWIKVRASVQMSGKALVQQLVRSLVQQSVRASVQVLV
jgi:hypothetical protein